MHILQITLTISKVQQIEKYTLNMQEETLPSSKPYVNTIQMVLLTQKCQKSFHNSNTRLAFGELLWDS